MKFNLRDVIRKEFWSDTSFIKSSCTWENIITISLNEHDLWFEEKYRSCIKKAYFHLLKKECSKMQIGFTSRNEFVVLLTNHKTNNFKIIHNFH